jgi:hypothetical protein
MYAICAHPEIDNFRQHNTVSYVNILIDSTHSQVLLCICGRLLVEIDLSGTEAESSLRLARWRS